MKINEVAYNTPTISAKFHSSKEVCDYIAACTSKLDADDVEKILDIYYAFKLNEDFDTESASFKSSLSLRKAFSRDSGPSLDFSANPNGEFVD